MSKRIVSVCWRISYSDAVGLEFISYHWKMVVKISATMRANDINPVTSRGSLNWGIGKMRR